MLTFCILKIPASIEGEKTSSNFDIEVSETPISFSFLQTTTSFNFRFAFFILLYAIIFDNITYNLL